MSDVVINTFPGGVYPAENKEQSTQTSIATLPIFKEYILPLNQHLGIAAKPLVSVGERVLKGQLIAQAGSFVSAPVHAPTSGIISAIREHKVPHPSGLTESCIILTSDNHDCWVELQPIVDYKKVESQQLIEQIYRAGVVGLGGAGFPSALKMVSQTNQNEKRIHTLIVNGAECEPYITADDMLMRERAEEIVSGIDILQHLLDLKQVLIGIEDNKPQAILALTQACSQRSYQVITVPTKYPSGDAQFLIYTLTGKEIPSDERAVESGLLCYNVGTLTAIHNAVVHGKPLISRITTLTGDALTSPQNVEALIGSPINQLLSFAGVKQELLYNLVLGGSMMGFSLEDTNIPIIKTTNCLIAGTKKELPPSPPAQACIRCGLCSEACPCSLLPQQLFWHASAKNNDQLMNYNLFDCIECGACAFVCPSTIPLVQYYRAAKDSITLQQTKQVKSEQSKQRFEFRQQRLIREHTEKEARRKANSERVAKRQAAQKADPDSLLFSSESDPVQQAIARAKAKAIAKKSVVETMKTDKSALSPQQKELKIQVAMATAQLKKNQRGLTQTQALEQEVINKLNADSVMLQEQINTLKKELAALSVSSENTQIPASAIVDNKKRTIAHGQDDGLDDEKYRDGMGLNTAPKNTNGNNDGSG